MLRQRSFADYFKLNIELDEVLAFFGYSYRIQRCELPRKSLPDAAVEESPSRGLSTVA